MYVARTSSATQGARNLRRLSANTVLVLMIPIFLAPVIWTVVQSLLSQNSALRIPPVWFTVHPTIANYSSVFSLIPFLAFLVNSIKITLIVTVGSLVTSTLAAYAFARLRFPGRDVLFFMFLAALMVSNKSQPSRHMCLCTPSTWRPVRPRYGCPASSTCSGFSFCASFPGDTQRP